MKPYQPSLAAPPTGLLILLLAVLLGGAAIGALAALLSNLVYVIILFPIGMGWLGGKLVAAPCAWEKYAIRAWRSARVY